MVNSVQKYSSHYQNDFYSKKSYKIVTFFPPLCLVNNSCDKPFCFELKIRIERISFLIILVATERMCIGDFM